MFIASVSSKTADFDVKRSFNILKLLFLIEETYLISCMIYYKYINRNNKIFNNLIIEKVYDKKGFNSCIFFNTAYYNVISIFVMSKVRLITEPVY